MPDLIDHTDSAFSEALRYASTQAQGLRDRMEEPGALLVTQTEQERLALLIHTVGNAFNCIETIFAGAAARSAGAR